jgi:fatty acid-binding protein DegV
MAGVHIVTDSMASLPRDAASSYGISIVPQVVTIGDDLYHEPFQDPTPLWPRLADPSVPVHILVAEPEEFARALMVPLEWGVEVVALHGPNSLFAAADAARAALDLLPAGAPVTVIETNCLGPALGLLAIQAALAGADGSSRDEVAALVADSGPRARSFAYLADAGAWRRCPALTRWLGPAPTDPEEGLIVELADGRPQLVARAAGAGAALRQLAELSAAAADNDGPLHMALVSCGADAAAAALATFLQARLQPTEMWVAPAEVPLAAVFGEGAVGLGLYMA